MARTPHTKPALDSIQVKIWIDPELLEFVDEYREHHDRSRSYVINAALNRWVKLVTDSRERRKKRD